MRGTKRGSVRRDIHSPPNDPTRTIGSYRSGVELSGHRSSVRDSEVLAISALRHLRGRSESVARSKVMDPCDIQTRPASWFSDDVFMALLRLRGMECAAADRYAEAFYGRKAVLSFGTTP